MKWHGLSAAAVAQALDVDPASGLSDAEVTLRRQRHGSNRLDEIAGKPLWKRFGEQLIQPLVLVLVLAGTITAFLGEWTDASVILAVVLANALIGSWQEARAEGALAALARSVATSVVVRRNGHRLSLDAGELVPGDVVLLAAGDRVPADLRLFQAKSVQASESLLTGESLPVAKDVEVLPENTSLAERKNLLYAGTTLVAGQGCGMVVATGNLTETGKIAGLIARTPSLSTPLTRKMTAFSNGLLWAIGGLAMVTFVVGLLRGEAAFDMFMAAVALAVGAIPEGLPAAVTITLAIGVARMARRRAIIRHLPAVETLGSTTVICSDKTGTLTENAMTVRAVWCRGRAHEVNGQAYVPLGQILDFGEQPEALRQCLTAAALCNDASLSGEGEQWAITGDPTEAALDQPRLDELPFDASRQLMATLHKREDDAVLYVKGAVERLLPRCPGSDHPEIEAAARQMAGQGMRVLAVAGRRVAGHGTLHEDNLGDLEFYGLIGMIDPPRPQAMAAIRACQAAGIRVKMITGDHAATAMAIARQLGLNADTSLTGSELACLDEDALAKAVHRTDIFARVEPEQKLRLVQALQRSGEVVAMTGDGVNDAPALKQADIGVAMGRGGTEVAREASAMVLTDDNFATIEAAIEEGRGVWDNLVKFITWTLPTNFGEGLVIVAAILFGTTLPITPLQILWINMTTAGLLGLTLAFEPIDAEIMRRPPRQPGSPLLDHTLIRRIVLVSFLLLGGAFGLFLVELEHGHSLAEARTVAVNLFVLVECLYLFHCRTLHGGDKAAGLFDNPWIWLGVTSMFGLQLLFTYWPPFNRIFHTAPIGGSEWLAILGVALLSSAIISLDKRYARRFT